MSIHKGGFHRRVTSHCRRRSGRVRMRPIAQAGCASGAPSFATTPPLGADHHVKPERGRLVLFPAYMWHGVEPFESEEPRLSVAFDVVPA